MWTNRSAAHQHSTVYDWSKGSAIKEQLILLQTTSRLLFADAFVRKCLVTIIVWCFSD